MKKILFVSLALFIFAIFVIVAKLVPAEILQNLGSEAIIATGIVVAWYTLETFRIRRVNQEQLEILKKQLEITNTTLRLSLANAVPVFQLLNGAGTRNSRTFVLENKGALITHLEVFSDSVDKATVNLGSVVATGQKIEITLLNTQADMPGKGRFRLIYTSQTGMRESKWFCFHSAKNACWEEQGTSQVQFTSS